MKVTPTPTLYDNKLGCFLKLECKNPSGSHKDRETTYLIEKFGRDRKYIVISSGNAGISLAYWMREKAYILVPKITPKRKIDLIKSYGANVIIKGKYYKNSYNFVQNFAQKLNLTNISPGFVDRWRGDTSISFELLELSPEYVFVPSANHTLAYGIAYGFWEMLENGKIKRVPKIVSCVVPDHPFIKLTEEIGEEHKEIFNSIYTHGNDGRNLRREFLDFPFTKVDSTLELKEVIKLGKAYEMYDAAVWLAMYISRKYEGRKVVIVTGVKR